TEFKKFPELRKFIEWLNFQSKRFRSFGCDGGNVKAGLFCGYIEFAFRKKEEATKYDLYEKVFNDFESWAKKEYPDRADAICNSLDVRIGPIRCYGADFGYKITLWFGAQTQTAAAQLLDI